jgi:IS5 family transposase
MKLQKGLAKVAEKKEKEAAKEAEKKYKEAEKLEKAAEKNADKAIKERAKEQERLAKEADKKEKEAAKEVAKAEKAQTAATKKLIYLISQLVAAQCLMPDHTQTTMKFLSVLTAQLRLVAILDPSRLLILQNSREMKIISK